jgi:hypothetical protein
MGLEVLAVKSCGYVVDEQWKEALGVWKVVVVGAEVADRQELAGAREERVDAQEERCCHRGRK